MIKTKLIGLVLTGTMVGAGIGAALATQINNNTNVATTTISQEAGQVTNASGLMDKAAVKLNNLSNKTNNLKGQLMGANDVVNSLQSQNDQLREEVAHLTNEMSIAKKNLDTATANNKDLVIQIKEANAKIDTLNSVIEKNDKLIANQKHDIEQKNLALQDYTDMYKKETAKVKDLNSQLVTEKDNHKKDNELNKSEVDKLNANAKSDMQKVEVAVNNQTEAINEANTKANANDKAYTSATENLTKALSR